MNDALDRLARDLGLAAPEQAHLRYAFAHACVLRVRHLLEDARAGSCLAGLGRWLAGECDDAQRDALAAEAAALANHHPGSRSIDGCGHAAVSATYAVARALAGDALQAADYAAYATVYAQGGAAAGADRDSVTTEFRWQADGLAQLATLETE
ncbi:MAG: hypothetical protein ACHP7E_11870 [Burkholderiales bacterium]